MACDFEQIVRLPLRAAVLTIRTIILGLSALRDPELRRDCGPVPTLVQAPPAEHKVCPVSGIRCKIKNCVARLTP
jgi:hypothetical protein